MRDTDEWIKRNKEDNNNNKQILKGGGGSVDEQEGDAVRGGQRLVGKQLELNVLSTAHSHRRTIEYYHKSIHILQPLSSVKLLSHPQTKSTHKCITRGILQQARKFSLPNQAIEKPITLESQPTIHQPPFRDPSWEKTKGGGWREQNKIEEEAWWWRGLAQKI